jgi:hypothetical protein
MHTALVAFARVVFGLAAAIAFIGLFVSGLAFDAPGSTGSLVTWSFALSPIVYLLSYAVFYWKARRGADPSGPLVLVWSLCPLFGLAWMAFAIVLVQVLCGGKFVCRYQERTRDARGSMRH